MVRTHTVCSIITLLFISFIAKATNASTIELSNSTQDFPVNRAQMSLMVDKGDAHSFSTVRSPLYKQHFKNAAAYPTLALNTAYWLKLSLFNSSDSDKNWVIQFPLHSKELWVYIPDDTGKYHEHKIGQRFPFSSRSIDVRTLTFELPSQRNTYIEIYVKIYTQKHTDLSVIISPENKYLEVHTKGYFFLGIIYGILLLMSVYNLILFFTIREKIYMYYVFYTLSALFFMTWKDGLGFQFLWSNHPIINTYHHSISLLLLLTSFLLYANNLLEIKKSYPRLSLVTYLIIGINFLYFSVSVFDANYFNPLPNLYILSYCYLLGITVFFLLRKYKPARYLLVSAVCMVSALFTIKLRYLGLLDWNWFIEYILNYAIVIDAIVMSLAISDKFRYLKEQKKIAIEHKISEEKLKIENELIQLKNQTLQFEITQQNNQLANFATNSIQKIEFLHALKKELEAIAHEIANPTSLKKLIKTIDKESEEDNRWEEFQLNFDKAHHNFLRNLKEDFPILKPGDLLLCAYIKIDKSNKEIATILSITISGVEKKRMRLKEKLLLDNETALIEFIQNRK